VTRSNYFVGLDLAQSFDFTAIAVLERVELTGEWDAALYTHRKTTALRLRYLERVALGTPYTEVVERVAASGARPGPGGALPTGAGRDGSGEAGNGHAAAGGPGMP